MLRYGGCLRNFSSFVALAGRFSNEMGTTTSCMDGGMEWTLAFVMGLIPWERWRLEVGYLGLEFKKSFHPKGQSSQFRCIGCWDVSSKFILYG